MTAPETLEPGLLELRYRRVLRLLPASYRRVWEEDMVVSLLESATAGDVEDPEFVLEFGRPSWSEVASIIVLAVRLRIGTAAAPPLYRAWGAAVRLIALLGLLANAVLALTGVGFTLWLLGRLPWLPPARSDWVELMRWDGWQTFWFIVGFAWVAAYVALLLGQRRVARLLAAAAIAPGVVSTVARTVEWAAGGPGSLLIDWLTLLYNVFLVLALTAFHGEAPPVRPRPWLLALAGAVPVTFLLSLPTTGEQHTGGEMVLFDLPAMYCIALTAIAVVYLVGTRFGWPISAPTWSPALAVLALAAFTMRMVGLYDLPGDVFQLPPTLLALGVAEAVAVAAVALPLAVRARRALRQLPTDSPDTTAWSGR